jgi:CBS-domain-containing membrane protein
VAHAHDPETVTARDIMSREILCCHDTDGADDVTRRMGDEKIRRMPVLNKENRLVGMVTLGDLASHSNHVLCGETLGKICRAPQSDQHQFLGSFSAF